MKITIAEIQDFVEKNIGSFHQKRILNIQNLELLKLIKRKNPYLFKAKNLLTAPDLVKSLLDAHLSSQEETMFGDFLEELAIYINRKVYKGQKSSAEGIDLEFTKKDIRYIIAIKSGPNWGNSQQILKMKQNFDKATRILRTSNSRLNIRAINGCCYGRCNKSDLGSYEKLCGQKFWELISGMKNLYIDIIEPLGYRAKEKNEEFLTEYSKVINLFTLIFTLNFCHTDGGIDWEKILKVNSGDEEIKINLILPAGEDIIKTEILDNDDSE